MKQNYKTYSLRIITALMLISLPFLGSDCEDIINEISDPTGDITGNWTLIYNAGTTLDICPGETVYFPNAAGGTAQLLCPGGTEIQRDYTVSGTTLTYTASGTEYSISYTQNNELVMTGINNNRILYYSKTITDKADLPDFDAGSNSNLNSSEIK